VYNVLILSVIVVPQFILFCIAIVEITALNVTKSCLYNAKYMCNGRMAAFVLTGYIMHPGVCTFRKWV